MARKTLYDVQDDRSGEPVVIGVDKRTAQRERERLDREAAEQAARPNRPDEVAGALLASPAVEALVSAGAVDADGARRVLEADALNMADREPLPPATHSVRERVIEEAG